VLVVVPQVVVEVDVDSVELDDPQEGGRALQKKDEVVSPPVTPNAYCALLEEAEAVAVFFSEGFVKPSSSWSLTPEDLDFFDPFKDEEEREVDGKERLVVALIVEKLMVAVMGKELEGDDGCGGVRTRLLSVFVTDFPSSNPNALPHTYFSIKSVVLGGLYLHDRCDCFPEKVVPVLGPFPKSVP